MKTSVLAGAVWLCLALAACGSGPRTPPGTPPPSPTPPPPGPPPTSGADSDTLIRDALARGEIDADTALKYRVFAAFNDARLPARFKGDDSGLFETDALEQLNTRFDSLSSEDQAALGAFLLRPSSKGSWASSASTSPSPSATSPAAIRASATSPSQALGSRPACDGEASGWDAINTVNLQAKVWYRPDVPDDLESALVVAAAIDTEIWPSLIATLGFRQPVDDTSRFGCYGGDARLDVYLVHKVAWRGLTVPEGFDTHQGPVYIMLNRDELSSDSSLSGGMAHELMHAIQWSYKTLSNQDDYGWMREAMANWAIDHVYGKTVQTEQQYADCFTSTPELSLDDPSEGHCKKQRSSVGRDYGAYLFFQFIARTVSASTVRDSLSATTRKATSLEAVESVIPGGFRDQWWKFARTLWNQPPIDARQESFRQWDGLTETAKTSPDDFDIDGDLRGAPEEKEPLLDQELNNLSSRYYHFKFSDKDTRSILFYNGFFDQIQAGKAITIVALWKDADGTWHEEGPDPQNPAQNWSQYKYVGLCRDIKSQRASALTIIVANGEKEPHGKVRASAAPYLKRSNVGCLTYEGNATSTIKDVLWTSGQARAVSSKLTFEMDPSLRMLDAKNPDVPDSLRVGLTLPMMLTGADFTYEDSHTKDACSFSLPPTPFTFAAGLTTGFLFVSPFDEVKSNDAVVQALLDVRRSYFAVAADGRPGTLLVGSPTECASEASRQSIAALIGTGGGSFAVVKPDGTMGETSNSVGSTYTLAPRSEP